MNKAPSTSVTIKNTRLPKNTDKNTIKVRLVSGRDQIILIGKNLDSQFAQMVKTGNYDRVVIFIDSSLKKLHEAYLKRFIDSVYPCEVVFIKVHSSSKNFVYLDAIIKKLIAYRVNRGSAVVAMGGGTLIDLVGFTVSIYMRGVDFIAVPTTFMAQGDTVIGKVGINYKKFKHILGSFFTPTVTLCDTHFLESLDKKGMVEGLVEVWKHALLKRDAELLKLFSEVNFHKILREPERIAKVVICSILIKKCFVERDALDKDGSHAALSLGHTFANYLEQDNRISHGEAVLVGIIFSVFLSHRMHLLSVVERGRMLGVAALFFKNLNFNKRIFKMLRTRESVLEGLKFDKMNTGVGGYTFVVPTTEGYLILKKIQSDEIIKCLELLEDFLMKEYLSC